MLQGASARDNSSDQKGTVAQNRAQDTIAINFHFGFATKSRASHACEKNYVDFCF
jgi:hypothetical protein